MFILLYIAIIINIFRKNIEYFSFIYLLKPEFYYEKLYNL